MLLEERLKKTAPSLPINIYFIFELKGRNSHKFHKIQALSENGHLFLSFFENRSTFPEKQLRIFPYGLNALIFYWTFENSVSIIF